MPKNSTNGALADGFRAWQAQHPEVSAFILVGDCTDICILQLALALKAAANEANRPLRVIVPIDMTDTFDLDVHEGNLMHLFALYNMLINGVEVVSSIE